MGHGPEQVAVIEIEHFGDPPARADVVPLGPEPIQRREPPIPILQILKRHEQNGLPQIHLREVARTAIVQVQRGTGLEAQVGVAVRFALSSNLIR